MQQQQEEEATIRETKSLMSGQLEATGGEDALDDDEGLLHNSNGAGADDVDEEGIEHPMDEAQGLPAANGGDGAFVETKMVENPPASKKRLMHKSSSLLADAAHISMPLYRHPRQRQRWGDTQVHPVKEWGDIFFDLFYVAAAYNLGNQLKADPTLHGLLYLVGTFLPIIGLWLQKLVYDARFYVGDDLSHRFYEVAVFLAIASSILHIGPVSVLSHPAESPEMFAFSVSLTVGYFLAIGRFVEVCVCQRLGCKGLYPEAFAAALHNSTTFLPPLAFYTAATIYSGVQYYSYANSHSDYSSSSGYLNDTAHDTTYGENATSELNATDAVEEGEGNASHRWLAATTSVAYSTPTDDVTIWLLLAGAVSSIVSMTLLVVVWLNPSRRPGFDPKTITVPMNVDYTIHRYGEWVMLLLGESVLSLLIVKFIPSQGYQQVFYCGVVSIALLQYLHFRSQPHHADEHAMRRSRNAGIFFVTVLQIYSIALVVMGSSFKMLLYEQVYEDEAALAPVANYTRRATSTIFSRLLADATVAPTASTAAAEIDKTNHNKNVAMFFCISLAIVWFCLDVMLLLHRGIQKHKDDVNKCSRLRCVTVGVLILCRVALVVFMATYWLTEVRPAVLTLVGLVCIVLQLLTREAGECLFKGDDSDDERDAAENALQSVGAVAPH